jgi:hypothetical protein
LPTITFSATSVPTTAQAQALIGLVTSDVSRHLRAKGAELPITDSDALASLRTVASYGSAAAILKAKYPATEGAGGDKGAAGFWEARYTAALADIAAGSLTADTQAAGGSFAHGFIDSEGTALCDSELVTRVGLETEF